jgi:hypothetical protein
MKAKEKTNRLAEVLLMVKDGVEEESIRSGTHISNRNISIEETAEEFITIIDMFSREAFDDTFVKNTVPYTEKRNGTTMYFGNFENISNAFYFKVKTGTKLDRLLKDTIAANPNADLSLSKRDSYLKNMSDWIRSKIIPTREGIDNLLCEVDKTISEADLLAIFNKTECIAHEGYKNERSRI